MDSTGKIRGGIMHKVNRVSNARDITEEYLDKLSMKQIVERNTNKTIKDKPTYPSNNHNHYYNKPLDFN